MALTTAQKISVYEILEVPYPGSVDMPSDQFNLSAITHSTTSTSYKLTTKINDRLSALDSDEETKLKSYITSWDALGVKSATVEGGVGGISGVSFDYDNERINIQRRVKVLIPVMRYLEEIKIDNAGAGAGGVIPVNR